MQPAGRPGLPGLLALTDWRNSHFHPPSKTVAGHHRTQVAADSQVHASTVVLDHGIPAPSLVRSATGGAAPPVGTAIGLYGGVGMPHCRKRGGSSVTPGQAYQIASALGRKGHTGVKKLREISKAERSVWDETQQRIIDKKPRLRLNRTEPHQTYSKIRIFSHIVYKIMNKSLKFKQFSLETIQIG